MRNHSAHLLDNRTPFVKRKPTPYGLCLSRLVLPFLDGFCERLRSLPNKHMKPQLVEEKEHKQDRPEKRLRSVPLKER